MQKVRFAYNEPMIGMFENDGPDMTVEEILKEIEIDYPEAIDVEIIEIEETV